ncbi:hypothetical protein M426DRAFT_21071 [Hypoxylon sp. CI-4A]|nr:hypothetical protein M426DRAFT_21071 [Hypoxylon sp. CI-4A]
MPDFEFVNVSRPGDVKRQSTKIRRHVMKDIGKARRKPRPRKRREVIMGERSPSAAGAAGDETPAGDVSRVLRLPSPNMERYLHTLPYPINMDEDRMNLVRYLVDEARSTYRPFRFPWMTMGLSDSAAWYITLANAALYRGMTPGSKKPEFSTSDEAMKWYTLSLSSITQRISSAEIGEGEGLIIAITGFSSTGNFERFCVHMEGLQRILDQKGGLDNLTNPFLRLMISWLDLAGATFHNAKPRFRPLKDSIRQIETSNDSQYLEQLLETWDTHCPALGDIVEAMKATAAVASYINRRCDAPNFWTDDVTIARLLSPAYHEILALEGRPLPDDPSDVFYSSTASREAFRRAALVFLGAVKIRMGAGAYEIDMHLDAFRAISQLPYVDWNLIPELNLWAHIISAMQEESPNRAWHVLTIVGIMEMMGLETGNQAIDIARGVIWVDAIDEGKSSVLCREIDGYLEASKLQKELDEETTLDPRLTVLPGTSESVL